LRTHRPSARRRTARPLIVGTAGIALLLPAAGTLAPAAAAPPAPTPGSLPSVSTGARPGPDVLYAAAPRAPQLENRSARFHAAPLLVSGTEAYAEGEYLYQDFLYDDYGTDTNGAPSSSQLPQAGEITYPTAPQYAGNAADLVEFRAAPGADDVVYRFTLNALVDEGTTAIALAFDTDRDASTGASTLPRDPGAAFPGTDQVLAVSGARAELSRLSDGAAPVTTAVPMTVDLEANQLTVTVPRSVSDPRGTWRATLAVGLHDPATGGWKRPALQATAETPGGAGPAALAPSGIFNLGFRFDEPVLTQNVGPDQDQAAALREGVPTRFARDLDFDAMTSGASRTTVPATGRQIRMFPSRLQLGEGRDLTTFPAYKGQLQPYAVYIPSTYRPGSPAGLTLSLHSLGQHYWQYQQGMLLDQQGEQRGNLVLSPLARGEDGWYQAEAEYDAFEAWNDLARHFTLDPTRAYSSGYSMGGYGTYRLAGLYPDLFARAFTAVGPPGDGIWLPPAAPTGGDETLSNRWLENFRNVPLLNIAGVEDELVPYVGPRAQNLGAPELGIRGLEQLGYDYRFVTFPAGDHFALAALGYDFPFARDHLGTGPVDRDPAHVTFAYVPRSDQSQLGLVHDHAYWVSQVRVSPTAAGAVPKGVVDVRTEARGVGEPIGSPVTGAGVAQLPYTVVGKDLAVVPPAPRRNALQLTLTDVSSVRLEAARAALDLRSPIRISATSSTDSSVLLAGSFRKGTTVLRDGSPVPATITREGITVPVTAGTAEYVVLPR
jgi:dienelactone hydrolase